MSDALENPVAFSPLASTLIADDEIMPWLPGGDLPAALTTGHRYIDFEHRQLLACMAAARSICIDMRDLADCSACGSTRRERCETGLVRLLGDLLSFILEHFKTEEEIMRDSLLIMVDRDLCEAHKEDHAVISAKIQEFVSALDRQHTVGLLREVDTLLGNWMAHHIAMHDMILARWVARQESDLKFIK